MLKSFFELLRRRVVFVTIIAENILRTLIVLVILSLLTNNEIANLGILQASMGIFLIVIPMGFGVSSQRFSIDLKSLEFKSANTLYYLISTIFIANLFFLWDLIVYKFEGLNLNNDFHKIIFLILTFLKVEYAKIKSMLRINGKNLLFVIASIVPVVFEFILVYLFINNKSNAFDLFFIRVITLAPILILTIYLFKYLTSNFYNKVVINYSLITIPNKLVTGSLNYFMNLFAFNLGTDFMSKFYSTLKITNILNTIMNAYYQYVEPYLYKKKGLTRSLKYSILKNIFLLTILFIFSVSILKLLFSGYQLAENMSLKIMVLISLIYIITAVFRFVSFKLFYILRNDLIFYVNLIAILIFVSISYMYPNYFLQGLLLGLTIKLFLTFKLNKIFLEKT